MFASVAVVLTTEVYNTAVFCMLPLYASVV